MSHGLTIRKPAHATRKAARRPEPTAPGLEGKRFEQFLEELSASFVRAPVGEIGSEIDRWIREIVLGHDLDRGALARLDSKSGELIVRHSWSRGNLTKLPVGLRLALLGPWFDRVLHEGRTVVFSKISDLPSEFFSSDWKTYRRYIPKSNVTVPLRVGGEVVGALGFATVKRERSWSTRLVRRIEFVGEVFGNALERRYTSEEIGLLRDELNHLSRVSAMGELSASLTHQLNQPIAAILSNAEAIQSMLESQQPELGELRSAVSDIIQDDLRATEVIKGLRGFFRRRAPEKAPIFLGEIVGDVMRIVRSAALFRNISLKLETPPERITVVADRVQLQQAILNLVLNAFDALSEIEGDRKVSIFMDVKEADVRLAISDTGSGIDPVTISRIFEPFFTTKPQGMGMGLAIARSIVKAHGGDLSARRNAECGSTFEISLPFAREERGESTAL
jgi:signal transduction histidine kinase